MSGIVDIADCLRSNESETYQVRGTKFLLTWRTHLDKERLKTWLSEFSDIRDIHIAHELPDTDFNFEHTNCAICFEKRVSRKEKNAFNVWNHKADDGTNDNIQSIVNNIKASKEDWNKVCCYVNKSNIEEKARGTELRLLAPERPIVKEMMRERRRG